MPADKTLYPDCGLSKSDVVGYFESVSERMLPYMRDRFLTLHRFPDGIESEGFYQQSRSDYFPAEVLGRSAPRASGEDAMTHIMVYSARGLTYLAGQATLAFHGWQSRCDRLRKPDRLVFDLDPAKEGFGAVLAAARLLREVFRLVGLEPFVMTTGSRGLHVVAPLKRYLDFEALRDLARRMADALVSREPNRFTREQRKAARKGRLYLDIGRNAYGQTAILPYSLRALPGAPAATPLGWDELERSDIGPQRFNLRNLGRRSAQKVDPWEAYFSSAARPRTGGAELVEWANSG
jgi:bifunctional non-homologous end joining protein LigD